MSGAQFGPLWTELNPPLSQKSLDVLERLGFERAAPVQATVVPLLCTNKDVAVEACTGSGKTLAFVLPLVEILLKNEADQAYKKHEVGAVVVSPTRELARQIFDIAVPFIANLPGPGATLLVGGSDSTADLNRITETGSRVLIGTPGRLNDVMNRSKYMVLKRVEMLVLDEADRLLSMGFSVAITSIIGRLPKQRRTGLFSATQTEEVEELARAGLRNPVKVRVRDLKSGLQKGDASAAGGKTPNQLRLLYSIVEQRDKVAHLLRFVQLHAKHKTIVYFLTCACVDYFAEVMAAAPETKGMALTALHGRMKQSAREKALEAFSQGTAGVLLATDVAARGLDIPGVEWILQYDPPQDPDSFVHRVGRTARMGSSGSSLALLLPAEETYVEFLRLRQVVLEQAPPMEGVPAGPAVTAALRRRAEAEREVAEKGARAFVSYMRGYKEHQCQFIFRLKELPLGFLAASFGVLRMPKMREIKRKVDHEGFTPSTVSMDDVPYRDKAREKQRQKTMRDAAAEAAEAAENVDEGEQGRAEKLRKREAAAAAAAAAAPKPTAAKRRLAQQREEDDELDEDYKMLKKLKKGKISEHQYNIALGLSDDEDDVDERGGAASSSGGDDSDAEPSGLAAARTGGAGNKAKDGGASLKQEKHSGGKKGANRSEGHGAGPASGKKGRGGGNSGGGRGRGGRGSSGGESSSQQKRHGGRGNKEHRG